LNDVQAAAFTLRGSLAPQLSQRSPIVHSTMIEPGATGTGLG
jgi:hypothetical protein